MEKGCRSCTYKCEGEGVYPDVNDRSPRHAGRARDAPLYIVWSIKANRAGYYLPCCEICLAKNNRAPKKYRRTFWEEEPQASKQAGQVTTCPVAKFALRRRGKALAALEHELPRGGKTAARKFAAPVPTQKSAEGTTWCPLRFLVGTVRLELMTSCMSSMRSNQLSYAPVQALL